MTILHGECFDHLQKMPNDSFEALVTDPPAGIGFMNSHWDQDIGGRNTWVRWMRLIMAECYRVLKPGAHGLVWALPRTSHWTATALEDAGFEIRDVVTHLFGTGFPKSMNLEKAGAGAPWAGWGTALKPASEHWILVRKPCSEKTVAANVLKHGTGGLNIDASRIEAVGGLTKGGSCKGNSALPMNAANGLVEARQRSEEHALGRFPANLILSHNPDCVQVGTKKIQATRKNADQTEVKHSETKFGQVTSNKITTSYGNGDGTETVPAWECAEGCAVKALDEQSGMLKSGNLEPHHKRGETVNTYGKSNGAPPSKSFGGDSGGASRFFYVAKASKSDKGDGNTHPTVKSTALMTYLITLITPPGGRVLDPFMGSGSTGVAAVAVGFDFLGIEQDIHYFNIAKQRLAL